jgi:hypothetical protein
MNIKCPYCNETQIAIRALTDSEGMWEDQYGSFWKRVSDATREEIELSVISRDYCFMCLACGSLLQHRYCNHEIVRQMEQDLRNFKKRVADNKQLEEKKLKHPTLF